MVTAETDPLALVGTTIADKYAVEAVVGQGGFATVYRANHLVWKRPVAVKVFRMLGEVRADQREKLLADFIQEGSLLADLSERSAAICQARDVGMLSTAAGETIPYMVLEWLEGKALDVVLEEERARGLPLRSLSQAVKLLEPVAEALALAHKKGIAHRDVKPANVFVLGDARGEPTSVKLLDFGIAKVVQDAQKMGFGKTAGHITSFTPFYGAPEQFDRAHGATGPWTDVFALALVVTETASGREPLSGDSLVQLAFASADPNRRPSPRALGVATSDEVEAVFQKALAIDPAKRYATAGEFFADLRAKLALDPASLVSAPRVVVEHASASPTAETVAAEALAANVTRAGAAPGDRNATTAPRSQPRSRVAPILAGILAVGAVAAGGIAWRARDRGAPPSSVGAAAVASAAASPASAPVSAAPPQACPRGMIAIPGGEFFMGSEEKDAREDEKPAHKVKLSPYCLDELEVTVAEFKACSDRGGCRRAGKENVWRGIKPHQQKLYDPLCNALDPVAKASHPINCVDWDQAREMCESRGARLPTEAEWEFAARGPDGRIYPWGDEPPNAELLNACGKECLAWMKKHPDPDFPPATMFDADDGFPTTAPVGSFPKGKSRYGIQDVVGNVWEWVADWHADYGAAARTSVAVDPKGPAKGTERVVRGGAWNGAMPSWVRPSLRFSASPDSRSYAFGFRCAKSL